MCIYLNEDVKSNKTEKASDVDLYSSMVETYKHKQKVLENINSIIHIILNRINIVDNQYVVTTIIERLLERGATHDNSKLEIKESNGFAVYTKKLEALTYGSDEYEQCRLEMKPFLDHHYENNRHHPEYYKNGIRDMDIIDIIEMLCDWKAAVERHKDGDISKSLEINSARFGYDEYFKEVLSNTNTIMNMYKEKPNSVNPVHLMEDNNLLVILYILITNTKDSILDGTYTDNPKNELVDTILKNSTTLY